MSALFDDGLPRIYPMHIARSSGNIESWPCPTASDLVSEHDQFRSRERAPSALRRRLVATACPAINHLNRHVGAKDAANN
jgi:hypothetical protein